MSLPGKQRSFAPTRILWVGLLAGSVALVGCGDDEGPVNNDPDGGGNDIGGGDIGVDTTPDIGVDTTPDIGVDTTPDIGVDTTPDIGVDTGTDTATDVGTDTAADTGADTATDVGTDTAADTGTDAGGPLPGNPVVFDDDYATGVSFAPFGGSTNNLSIDDSEFADGTSSLRIEVPAEGYTGGALVASAAVDMTGYNAVQFWAKASSDFPLNTAGTGNDSADSFFQVEIRALPLTSEWTQFTIPLVSDTPLESVTGLFHFAEGAESAPYTIWLDQIEFVDLGADAFGAFSGEMRSASDTVLVGATAQVEVLVSFLGFGDGNIPFWPNPIWLEWTSSDEDVATVGPNGLVTAVGLGEATITGGLAGETLTGSIVMTVVDELPVFAPETPAPTPTVDPSAVVAALFTDVYPDAVRPVDTFRTEWSQPAATLTNAIETVTGTDDNVLVYRNLDFVGINFEAANAIDISAATHLHFQLWTPDATRVAVNLVDFGDGGTFAPEGDNSNGEISWTSETTPALETGAWVTFDIPLSLFEAAGLTGRSALAQFIFVGRTGVDVPGRGSFFLDNIFFYTAD